jgi:adhesin transport system membrane fusion protein
MGRPLVFPELARAYPAFVDNQRLLFQRRKAALGAEVDALSRSLALTREELQLASGLLASGDIGRAEVLRLQKQEAELLGQINTRRNRFFQDAQEAMTKAEEDLSTQQQVLAEREVQLDRMQVLAPADGLVRNIQITTPGARVRPGEVILELLPTVGTQVLEAKLLPADIAHVRQGTRAAVKLDAFDYTVHGVLQGVVAYVSPDALQERTAQGDESFYRVLVEVDRAHLEQRNRDARNQPIRLQAGMFATVEFIVGEHTVLQYLAKPLLKTTGEALGER